ncbi:hypothetical protein EB796_018474 [Bugula neritina]|uniref:DUF19 domain-containing protein n=1 Tax=Bugula neritina TaxID=10212 RepID=A0A7J7JAF8_BUGNE|nr:hypothetical protein EB796_018474 [Bugula neritina]
MFSGKSIILCIWVLAAALFIGVHCTPQYDNSHSYNPRSYSHQRVCEEEFAKTFCRYKQLVNQKTHASCLSARDLVADTVTNCVVKDPVERVSQGIQHVLLFKRNCERFYIDFPAEGCGRMLPCIQTLFESDGKTVNCSKKDEVDRCYENGKRCNVISNIQDLVINRFVPQICPAVRPALPTNCY